MKLLGDVPKEYVQLAVDLSDMELMVDKDNMVAEFKAKIYTCLAHDWLDIDMEEEGIRLISKAEKTCPQYYEKFQREQMKKDPQYNELVRRLATLIINTTGCEVSWVRT